MIWIALGTAIGCLAWVPFGISWQLAVLWLVVMVWLFTPSRKAAFTLFFFYYLVTSRDIGQIIHRFSFGKITEVASWTIGIICFAVIALLWAFAWQRRPLWRFCGLVLILIATSVPPLGGFIYGSPLLAAGWLFPDMGFVGIALLVISWGSFFALAVSPKPNYKNIAGFICCCLAVVSALSNVNYSEPDSSFAYSLNTKLPVSPVDPVALYERHILLTKAAQAALNQPYPIVIMPEEIGGLWQPKIAWLWEDVSKAYKDAKKTLVVGFDTVPDQYANTAKVFGLNPDNAKDVLAKVSAPIGGWWPWSTSHAPARWLSPATMTVNNRELIFIFCWEELVPWPWLAVASHTTRHKGKAYSIVTLANHWWAKDLDIGDSQARSTQAWSRLFGWSYQRVVNEL